MGRHAQGFGRPGQALHRPVNKRERNKMRGTMLRPLLAAAMAVLLVAPAAAQDKVKLRYGQIANSARSVSSLALNIAQHKGFLAKENIDLEIVGLRGVQYQVEELDKGT